MSKSEVYFEDKWAVFEDGSAGRYFVEFEAATPIVQTLEPVEPGEAKVYSKVFFRAASKRRVYELDKYKVLSLLGDLGGLLDIIMAIGVLITIGYVKKQFSRSLLGDAYQVQSYSQNNTELYPSKTARNCLKALHKP